MSRQWHVSDAQAARYADGSLPEPDAWSLEKHLESCTRCASRVSGAVRGTAADTVLLDVRTAVLAAAGREVAPVPAQGSGTGAFARRTRLLWAAGPAVRGAWLVALLVVAGGAMLLGLTGGAPGARTLLLAIAPVVPVAGVALSYGPHADPLHEVAASTPGGGFRLALTRTAAVLAVSLPVLTLAGALLPASGAPAAAAWLLPGLALTLATLAMGPLAGFGTASAVTAGGWLCAVLAPSPGEIAARLAWCLDGAPAQSAWAAAVTLSALLLAARRTAYDRTY
ncbi:zf-HC2 domain-containing protein [Streptomyces sp. NBC_01171]|uniref:zf-HC2 domain-containing protein n=1 Tax=Streptomyces sp. NBC_01171 TaxID=2903757 RepID=UPI0038668032|nr:zf-HC2 domain-containing protein [Streptomyces sp. NBC_01171]